jgi:hypothetical protein
MESVMGDYFRNLNNLDPHLNALVVTKLKEIQRRNGKPQVSIEDLSERDELELLREYCLNLYREYRTLRTMFLENMHEPAKREALSDRKN